jgi:starvation-inducible outer membrane lipoprotein
MKYLLVISMSLMLAGCSTMTRLLPKLEKIDLPEARFALPALLGEP